MRASLLIGTVLFSLAAPAAALAQASTATGAIGGAAAGAVVGGPVGAVVGGAVGATIGAAAEPPPEVRTYVVKQHRPSMRVEQVAIGQPLPPNVVLYEIPESSAYVYAVVNEQRVVVDPRTRKVLYIIE